jgi:ABC-type branched-subunit amino acid transport system substrate-binding protein
MSKKILLALIAAVLVVVPLSACTTPAPPDEPEPLKIGGIFCMTGPLAAMGDLISKGALLAVDEVNADGGVLDGLELELVIEDSATNDATAFEAYKKLVEVDGVEVVIGPMISGAVMSSGAYARAQAVPMVSPSATSPLISDTAWTEWALRTCTLDDLQGAVLANVIIDEGYDSAAILVQDTPYGIGLEDVITGILEGAGVAVVSSIRYDEEKLDYLTELNAIKDADPDVIIQVGYHTDSAVVYEQADGLGLGTKVWLVAEGVYGLLAEEYPAAAAFMSGVNLRGCTLSPEPDEPAYVAFVVRYESQWDESPSVYCDTVYDAVKLVALAIDEAGEYDGAKIKDELYKLGDDYNGASGILSWDENGDRVGATYGIWELVETTPGEYEYAILEYIPY